MSSAGKGIPGLPPGMPDPEAIYQSWWPIIIAIIGGTVYAFRQWMRGARCMSTVKLDGKVAIVTGSNCGIGWHIVKDLAERGVRVVMACRDETKGEAAADELRKKTGNINVVFMKCDLASFKSIRDFVENFKKKEENLHYLVNNAGVMMCPKEITEDNFEQQFQVNYLGHCLLTHLLLDTMKNSSPARIVNITAAAFQLGKIDFEDLNCTNKEYNAGEAYSQSKLAVSVFSMALANKLQESGVTVSVVNPGVVKTDLHRHMPFKKSAFISFTFTPFLWMLMKAAEDGAQTSLYCLLAESLENTSGCYFKECARTPIDPVALEEELQKRLWEETLKWLDVKEFGNIQQQRPVSVKKEEDS